MGEVAGSEKRGIQMTATLSWRVGSEPFDEHPWVLVTLPRSMHAAEATAAWAARGYEVCVCEGPQPAHPCPLVQGERCPIADRAHLVVNGLPRHARTDALLAALAEHHPDLPVVDLE